MVPDQWEQVVMGGWGKIGWDRQQFPWTPASNNQYRSINRFIQTFYSIFGVGWSAPADQWEQIVMGGWGKI
jgi:hypothetical protein